MDKTKTDKQKPKGSIISFRTVADVQKRIDREAKKRKQSRSEFVETVFMSGFETVTVTGVKYGVK